MRRPQNHYRSAFFRTLKILVGIVLILCIIIGGTIYVLTRAGMKYVPKLISDNAPEIHIGTDNKQEDPPAQYGPYDVSYVVDGDTLVVIIDNKEITVRLIGVDAPESVHPDKIKNTPEGKDASDWMKEYIGDHPVYLEYDIVQEDIYGRTLAYVYREDGAMIQEDLLISGNATTLTIQPNGRYAERFYELLKEAQKNKVGIWENAAFE